MAMVFNATFNDILWWSVLLVEVTGVPGENQTCPKSLTNFIVVSSTPHPELDSYLHG